MELYARSTNSDKVTSFMDLWKIQSLVYYKYKIFLKSTRWLNTYTNNKILFSPFLENIFSNVKYIREWRVKPKQNFKDPIIALPLKIGRQRHWKDARLSENKI
jgi:hypothetical protein